MSSFPVSFFLYLQVQQTFPLPTAMYTLFSFFSSSQSSASSSAVNSATTPHSSGLNQLLLLGIQLLPFCSQLPTSLEGFMSILQGLGGYGLGRWTRPSPVLHRQVYQKTTCSLCNSCDVIRCHDINKSGHAYLLNRMTHCYKCLPH